MQVPELALKVLSRGGFETPVASWCPWFCKRVLNGATGADSEESGLRVLRVTGNAGDVRCRPLVTLRVPA